MVTGILLFCPTPCFEALTKLFVNVALVALKSVCSDGNMKVKKKHFELIIEIVEGK